MQIFSKTNAPSIASARQYQLLLQRSWRIFSPATDLRGGRVAKWYQDGKVAKEYQVREWPSACLSETKKKKTYVVKIYRIRSNWNGNWNAPDFVPLDNCIRWPSLSYPDWVRLQKSVLFYPKWPHKIHTCHACGTFDTAQMGWADHRPLKRRRHTYYW